MGKTTLAQIIANKLETPFYTLSAVTSGVKDVRDVIEKARSNRFFSQASPILFIDEIHRFSKSQQDSLLGAVETGVVTLIGATTENPSFEVIRPLLSRCQLYVLKSLEKEDLLELLHNAIAKDVILKEKKIELKETDAMLRFSGGDARQLLSILELVVEADADAGPVVITDEKVTERLQQNPLAYDKDGGDADYDIISAFIKSIRGSDPDGALYWLARMVEAGEDPVFHSPQTGHFGSRGYRGGYLNALLLANAAFDAVMKIGWPEGRIPLAEATVYLAHQPQEQLGIRGDQQCPGTGAADWQPACPLAFAQRTHQADETVGLWQGLQVCTCLSGQFRAAAVPAGRGEGQPHLASAEQCAGSEDKGTDAEPLGGTVQGMKMNCIDPVL